MASLAPYTQPLSQREAGHLLRRTLIGPTQAEISNATGQFAAQLLQQLLVDDPIPNPPIDPLTNGDWVSPAPGPNNSPDDERRIQFFGWWIHKMHTQPATIHERMVWFWHTHFPTIETRISNTAALYYQHSLFRKYALGNFKTLTRAMCIDNAMLVHLDGRLNVAGSPQENFAREFFELFTVGKGDQVSPTDYTTFTETDVKEATRLLTGWDVDGSFTLVDPITGIPRGKLKGNGNIATQHDTGTKTFTAAFNNTSIAPASNQVVDVEAELDAFVDMVFASPHTAKFICRKLYRFFVYYDITPEIENDIIAPLAALLIQQNYEIKPVVEALLKSSHFFDKDDQVLQNNNIGAIIKSPMEITVGSLRTLEVSLPAPNDLVRHYLAYGNKLTEATGGQGMPFHEPYDVAGFDPYYQFPGFNRLWISPNYLAMRYLWSESITGGVADMSGLELFKLDMPAFVQTHCSNPGNADVLIKEMCDLLLPIDLDQARLDYFRDNGLLSGLTSSGWSTDWATFTQNGNTMLVEQPLEKMFRIILQSPEFQIY